MTYLCMNLKFSEALCDEFGEKYTRGALTTSVADNSALITLCIVVSVLLTDTLDLKQDIIMSTGLYLSVH